MTLIRALIQDWFVGRGPVQIGPGKDVRRREIPSSSHAEFLGLFHVVCVCVFFPSTARGSYVPRTTVR